LSLRPAGFIALPGGEGTGFDHADTFLGPAGSRLYVAHTAENAVDVIDCRDDSYLRSLPDLPGVAGVLVDTERDLLITSDRAAARVSVFRCSDEVLLMRSEVGPRPNGLAFDPDRGQVFSFNLGEPPGTNCTASVISIRERRVVRTIELPGRPRWAIFDPATDRVWANIQRPAVILGIDAGTLREVARIEVGAEGPHGLAVIGDRLFCAADGAELVVIHRGTVTKRLPLRGAPDVVMYDERRACLYVAIGDPGVVTSFDTDRLVELETVETELGAHTIGWDPRTSKLYAFAPARGGAIVLQES
jgi:DNA-binding beta-propeller fold protein YncE